MTTETKKGNIKHTVFHPETGVPYTGEPVDCSELVRDLGYTRTPPVIVAAKETDQEAEATAKADAEAKALAEATEEAAAMTVPALKDALSQNEVSFPSGANKADLVELYAPILLSHKK